MDKILVSIYVLTIDETYDIYILINKKAKETIKLIGDQLISKDNINEYNILGWQ